MRLEFQKIMNLAHWWKRNQGMMKVEVAALEPLLWREGEWRVAHVVSALKEIGFHVSMTSNGSFLARDAVDLKSAGLDLLRLSWHSMVDDTYHKITGGGSLKHFINGIHSALNHGLNISINRVLMRGYLADLDRQISFVDQYALRLKLLDLYWTPSSAADYSRYYISPEEALDGLTQPSLLTLSSELHPIGNRARVKFHTPGGAVIEYKISASAKKSNAICLLCSKQADCLEGYADYFRVFPDGSISLCYLRTDLAISGFNKEIVTLDLLGMELNDIKKYMVNIPIRFVLEGRCNFNCGFPESTASWCLKSGRGFNFPDREKVIKNEHK